MRPRPRAVDEDRVLRSPDRVQCEGCHRTVGIDRPADVPFTVMRETDDGRETITITVGRVVVHRCRLCADGEWR